jgi:hypothetical protein
MYLLSVQQKLAICIKLALAKVGEVILEKHAELFRIMNTAIVIDDSNEDISMS